MKNLIVILAALYCIPLQAYYQGAVTRGTGGAGIAAIEASETPFANPAGMAFLQGSYFTGAFGSGSAGEQEVAVALTENMRDTLIPTAFSYVQSHEENHLGKVVNRQFRIAMGKPVAKKMAWGFAIHHDENKIEEVRENHTNISSGLLYAVNERLGFAILAEDMISGENAEQTINMGMSYSFRKFMRFKLDATGYLADSVAKPDFAVGVENYLNKWAIFRFGAARDGQEAVYKYSIGLGFVLPRFGVHYAHQMVPDRQDLTSHSVDLAFPIW